MSTETKGKLLKDIEFIDGKVLRCVKEKIGSRLCFRDGDEFTIKGLSFRDNEGDLIVPVGDERDEGDADVYGVDFFEALFEEVVEQPDTNVPEQVESGSDELRELCEGINWSGIGIPEQGQRVRVHYEWLFVGIDSRGRWVLESTDEGYLKSFDPLFVLPIKTEEDKVVDDMYEIIRESVIDTKPEICIALFKAGYRKEGSDNE